MNFLLVSKTQVYGYGKTLVYGTDPDFEDFCGTLGYKMSKTAFKSFGSPLIAKIQGVKV